MHRLAAVCRSVNIYVANLAYSVTEADLGAAFEMYGVVQSTRIVYDKDTGRSRGFGFVEMSDRASAEAAIAALGRTELQGRKLRVSKAENRPVKAPKDREEFSTRPTGDA